MTEYTYVEGYRYSIDKTNEEYSLELRTTALRCHKLEGSDWSRWEESCGENIWGPVAIADTPESTERGLSDAGIYLSRQKAKESASYRLQRDRINCIDRVTTLNKKIASIQKLLDAQINQHTFTG